MVAHQPARTRSSDAYSIRDFFPPLDQGSILVITEDSDMAEVGESHALRNLGLHESLEFFDTGIEVRTEDGRAGRIEDQGNGPMISLLHGCS